MIKAQLGAELAQWWGFSQDIQNLIQFNADPLHAAKSKLPALVYIAIQIATGLLNNQHPSVIQAALPVAFTAHLQIPDLDWESDITSYRAIVDEVDGFF